MVEEEEKKGGEVPVIERVKEKPDKKPEHPRDYIATKFAGMPLAEEPRKVRQPVSYKNVLLCHTVADLAVNVQEEAIAVISDFSAVYYVQDGQWIKHDLALPPGPSLAKILDAVYPIGTVYTSADSTDPGKLFGGKWEELKPNETESEKFYRWKRIG